MLCSNEKKKKKTRKKKRKKKKKKKKERKHAPKTQKSNRGHAPQLPPAFASSAAGRIQTPTPPPPPSEAPPTQIQPDPAPTHHPPGCSAPVDRQQKKDDRDGGPHGIQPLGDLDPRHLTQPR